jgi:hypothetical protein
LRTASIGKQLIALLADNPDGCSRAILIARGFPLSLLNRLVRAGLPASQLERDERGDKAIEIVRSKSRRRGGRRCNDPLPCPSRTLWLDGHRRPDDYEIIHAGQTVGRVYRQEQDRPRALDADRCARRRMGRVVARVKSALRGSGRESLAATTSVDDPTAT